MLDEILYIGLGLVLGTGLSVIFFTLTGYAEKFRSLGRDMRNTYEAWKKEVEEGEREQIGHKDILMTRAYYPDGKMVVLVSPLMLDYLNLWCKDYLSKIRNSPIQMDDKNNENVNKIFGVDIEVTSAGYVATYSVEVRKIEPNLLIVVADR